MLFQYSILSFSISQNFSSSFIFIFTKSISKSWNLRFQSQFCGNRRINVGLDLLDWSQFFIKGICLFSSSQQVSQAGQEILTCFM